MSDASSAPAPVFPIGLKLEGRRCLVVGASDEAVSRALALARAGASVLLVAPTPPSTVSGPGSERVTLAVRPFTPNDLDGVWLSVLADRDAGLARELARESEMRRIFYCAVDQTEVGSFSHLAVARAGPLFAAIGSQGAAPALSRRLRELFDDAFRRSGLAEFAEGLAELRRRTPPERRRDVLNRAADALRLEGGFRIADAPTAGEAETPEASVEGGRAPGHDERGR